MREEKLLLSVKNTFAELPELLNGMPVSHADGHGVGTQSIRYVAEKLHGNCQFSVEGDRFVATARRNIFRTKRVFLERIDAHDYQCHFPR